MASTYPTTLDNFSLINPTDPRNAPSLSARLNDLGDAIEAIEAELGLDPSAASASVRVRLDAIDTLIAGKATSGSIVNADIAAGAAIVESKLTLASDAAAGTASRRTLGTGATQAAAGNHTHAQLHDRQHSVTSTSDHTFPGGTTNFLRSDGTFAAPSGPQVEAKQSTGTSGSVTWASAFATAPVIQVSATHPENSYISATVTSRSTTGAAAVLFNPGGNVLTASQGTIDYMARTVT